MAKRLVKDGKIILDGTLSWNEKVQLALKKVSFVEDFEERYGFEIEVLFQAAVDGIYAVTRKVPQYMYGRIVFLSRYIEPYPEAAIDLANEQLLCIQQLEDDCGGTLDCYNMNKFDFSDYGEKWFLTREDAIAYLKKEYEGKVEWK